jgi:hypothetical protein
LKLHKLAVATLSVSREWITTFLSTIFGALVSIGAVIFVEYYRQPKLKFVKEDPPHDPPWEPGTKPVPKPRYLRVFVSNELPPWFAARWLGRMPANQCRAAITFHHLDEQDVFGRVMEGRWSGTPEPIPLLLGGVAFVPESPTVNIYPGETESVDIAIRGDDDEACYGWNNESYFSVPEWRNPKWKLNPGRYLVRVVVTSSGRKHVAWFRLENSATRDAFRLEPHIPNVRHQGKFRSQSFLEIVCSVAAVICK